MSWPSSLCSWATLIGVNRSNAEFLTLVLHSMWLVVYSGLFTHRMKNPHLRAKLAEVLEAVMPHMETLTPGAVQPIMFQRQRVFSTYCHAPQLAEALITVFVDIEFTGQFLHYFSIVNLIVIASIRFCPWPVSQVILISLSRSLITEGQCMPFWSTCGEKRVTERALRWEPDRYYNTINNI